MGEVDSHGIAAESVLMQLLPHQCLLLGLSLCLRDIGGLCRRVRTIAIDRVALRGSHGSGPGGLRAGYGLFSLELLL